MTNFTFNFKYALKRWELKLFLGLKVFRTLSTGLEMTSYQSLRSK